MVTARDICTKALQKIGALVKSEPPSADEASDALDSLNAMIASWSNDSLNIYARTWETFNLTGAASYTIGTGGNFNTVRPASIIEAYIRNGTLDYPLAVVDDGTYNDITFKSLQGIPQFINYSNDYPLGIMRLYPRDNPAYTLFVLTEKPVTQFATLDTQMILPDGWERALVYNLAIELAPEYSQKPDASIFKIAKDSLGAIRTKVAQVRSMDAFPSGASIRNIFSGWRY
jgi:hypothetical protein